MKYPLLCRQNLGQFLQVEILGIPRMDYDLQMPRNDPFAGCSEE